MASLPSIRYMFTVRFLFCILIGCLTVHFLVEDTFFLFAFDAQELTQSNCLNSEESTHQDDLVVLTDVPEYIAKNVVSTAHLVITQLDQQIGSPQLPPPKNI